MHSRTLWVSVVKWTRQADGASPLLDLAFDEACRDPTHSAGVADRHAGFSHTISGNIQLKKFSFW